MTQHRRWLKDVPDSAILKSPPSAAERSAEQDEAAGGRKRRLVKRPDGRSGTASVQLFRTQGSRRIYATIRYKVQSRTVSRYLGEVSAPTRADALKKAWQLARKKRLPSYL